MQKEDESHKYIRELFHIAADYKGAVPLHKKEEVLKKLIIIEL